jgi:hypothetical protein
MPEWIVVMQLHYHAPRILRESRIKSKPSAPDCRKKAWRLEEGVPSEWMNVHRPKSDPNFRRTRSADVPTSSRHGLC